MRNFYLALILLLSVNAAAFAQGPVPELIWYKFDSTGTVVPNFATNPPTGTATATIMGGLTQNVGICDGSIIGSGVASSTDYVNTNWATNLTGTSWTISMRTKDITSSTTLFYIFGDGTAGSFRCFTNGVAGAGNWILRGGLTDVLVTGGAQVAPTMTTFVYDMSLGNIKAYLNGVLVNTVAQAGPTIAGAGPFKVIGYNSNVGCPLNGKLDDFRVYSRALSDIEVMSIYNGAVSNFLPADQALCPGDSLQLSIPYSGGTYTWNTGNTTSSIWADSAGTYIGSVGSTCANGTDTVVITAAPAPLAPGFAGPDDTICVGDTVLLSVATSDPIAWSTGDTTNSISVSVANSYTVEVTGQCGSTIDTVNIVQSALVYTGFAIADTTGGCEGDTILLGSTGMYSSYNWSTGDSTANSWATSGGTYYLTVSDACGAGMDSVIISPFIAGISAGFSFTTNMMDAIFTNTSSGGGNLQFTWDFGDTGTSNATSPSHTYAANGTYVVTLTVTNECFTETFMDTVVINFIGVANPTAMNVSVFPNPAHDRIIVASDFDAAQDVRVSLISLMGQVMLQQDFSNVSGAFRQSFDLGNLASGVYFVQVEGANGKHISRLVVE